MLMLFPILCIYISLSKEALFLKSSKQLYENNKKTVNEIWSFTPTTTMANEDPVVCTSINLFNLRVEKYQTLSFFIFDTLPAHPTGFLIYHSSPFQFNPNSENR